MCTWSQWVCGEHEREIEGVSTWSQWVCGEHERGVSTWSQWVCGEHERGCEYIESVGMWGT